MSSSKFVSFSELDSKTKNLLKSAVAAREFAYCPYSNFKVGAAVLCADGGNPIYTGCNVENVSYGVTLCAERAAYAKAVSDGKREFRAVAVVAYQEKFVTTPCGACRQFMSEFGDVLVFMAKPQLEQVMVSSLAQLLPHSFQNNADHSF